jgi:hypothetical protein
MVDAKCWHQIAEGYSISNIERKANAGYRVLESDGYEGVNSATSEAINMLDSSPGGSIYRGD